MSSGLYNSQLMQDFKNNKFRGFLKNPNFISTLINRSCKDSVRIEALISNEKKIIEIKFQGEGCILSQVATFNLCRFLVGKTMDDFLKMTPDQFVDMMGLKVGPNRAECVLLPFESILQSLS